MAELNEEQLLLLDNLMYYSDSAKSGNVQCIVERMIADAKAGNTDSFSGGFESNLENVIEFGEAILKDPELCNLTIVDSVNTEGVRASCFVDVAGEAIIAIRGTGGTYEAWSDNFQGAYQSDTDAQMELADFVNRQAETYSDITITGHSKGGNMAQYATVVCGDAIDRCVSFDGQGFGDEFLRKYDKEIQANAGKIKSVCASGDYVNILLFSIAGETVYLETNNESFVDNHSSFYLWKSNSGQMENGEFSNTVEQSLISKGLDAIADSLIMAVDRSNPLWELLVVNIIGSGVAMLMSKDDFGKNLDNIYNHLIDIIQDTMRSDNMFSLITSWIPGWSVVEELSYLKNLIQSLINKIEKQENGNGRHSLSISTEAMDDALIQIQLCINEIGKISDKLDGVKLDGKINLLMGYKLKNQKKSVENVEIKMQNLHTGLEQICDLYMNTEKINIQLEA